MKGLKKLALASAVLALSTGAFAMEALQDDALSDTTGQAGLTIRMDNLDVKADTVRYYDSDGVKNIGGSYALAPAATFLLSTSSSAGSVNMAGFEISATSIITTIDVGGGAGFSGAGLGSFSQGTGLFLGTTISGLTVALGAISFDNGDETLTAGTSAANIGGIALENISTNATLTGIFAGSPALAGATGYAGFATSAITIQPMNVITTTMTVDYYDTNKHGFSGGALTSVGALNDGLVRLPVYTSLLQGQFELGAGTNNAMATETAAVEGNGLVIAVLGAELGGASGETKMNVDLGYEGGGRGGAGITLAGADAGSVGINNLTFEKTLVISVTGH